MADGERGPYAAVQLLDHELKHVPWSAADFTARDAADALVAGGWLPVAADLATFAYTLVGRIMTVFISINTAPVASAPVKLCIAIPAGKVCATRAGAVGFMVDQAARSAAWIDAVNGDAFIRISRLDFAALGNGPSNTIHGQITFEVRP